jgi:hypothetical protein
MANQKLNANYAEERKTNYHFIHKFSFYILIASHGDEFAGQDAKGDGGNDNGSQDDGGWLRKQLVSCRPCLSHALMVS